MYSLYRAEHIHVVTPLNRQEFTVVDITDIMSNCISISFEGEQDRAYISKFPNRLESD